MHLFALHAADGTPILVTDSREAAIAIGRSPVPGCAALTLRHIAR